MKMKSRISDFRGEGVSWEKYKLKIYGSIQSFYDNNYLRLEINQSLFAIALIFIS